MDLTKATDAKLDQLRTDVEAERIRRAGRTDAERAIEEDAAQALQQIDAERARRSHSDLDAGAARAAAYIGTNGAEPARHSIESGADRARNYLNN